MSAELIYCLIGIAIGSVGTSVALSLVMIVGGVDLSFPEDRDAA